MKQITKPKDQPEVSRLRDQLAEAEKQAVELKQKAHRVEADAETARAKALDARADSMIGEGAKGTATKLDKAADKLDVEADEAIKDAEAASKAVGLIRKRYEDAVTAAQNSYDAECLAELSALIGEAVSATGEASNRMQAVLDFQREHSAVSVRKFKSKVVYPHLLTLIDRDGKIRGWNGAIEWIGSMRRAGWVESTPFDDISSFRRRFETPAEKAA